MYKYTVFTYAYCLWGLVKMLRAKIISPPPSLPSICSTAQRLYIYLAIVLYLLPLISQKHNPNQYILYTYSVYTSYTI